MESKIENSTHVLEKKSVDKYFLDGEEITESDYKAIEEYIKRVRSQTEGPKHGTSGQFFSLRS
jgi:hypothetical protein